MATHHPLTHLATTAMLLPWSLTCVLGQDLPTLPVFDDQEAGQAPPPAAANTSLQRPSDADKAPQRPDTSAMSLPSWEAEFSNLPSDQRAQYTQQMLQAKAAYQTGNTELCLMALGACELIFDQNPHAINLKISCLLDLNRLDELPPLIKRSRELLPDNEVADLSESSLMLALGKYEECITISQHMLDTPHYQLTPLVRDVLRYRILLSHLAMGRTEQAKKLVEGLNPLSDTPLYYMSEVAFNICEGNPAQANQNMKAARNIFAPSGQLAGFIRAFNQSQLEDKIQASSPH